MTVWRISVLIVALFVLGACSSAVPYKVADDQVLVSRSIIDQRPAEELKGGLPLFNNPTYTVPDSRFDPPLLDLFANRLAQSSVGTQTQNLRIVIDRFRAQNYYGRYYGKAQAASMTSTAIASGNVAIGAYFSAAQSGKGIDVVLVEIKGTIGDTAFEGAGAIPYDPKPGMTYMGMVYDLPEAREATRQAIDMAITDALSNISNEFESQ